MNLRTLGPWSPALSVVAAALLSGCATAGGPLPGSPQPDPAPVEGRVYDRVTTRELEVVGHDGTPRLRVKVGAQRQDAILEMLDEDGVRRVELAFDAKSGSWIHLMDEKGVIRWHARASTAGGAILEMMDDRGRVRLRIGTTKDGEPVVEALDEDGTVRRRFPE